MKMLINKQTSTADDYIEDLHEAVKVAKNNVHH